jgi:uncharacterized protein (DUF2236 family)
VHATLWDTSVQVFELLVRRLDTGEKESYYRETRRFAALFGIESSRLPASWEGFEDYNRAMWSSGRLAVGPAARRTADFLFEPHPPFPGPVMRRVRAITAGLMPEPLRTGFGLPWGPRERRIFDRSLALARRGRKLLPARLRFVPAYQDALRRLRGETRRDRVGELLNRLWLGA